MMVNMMVKIIPFLTNIKKHHRKKTALLGDVIEVYKKNLKT